MLLRSLVLLIALLTGAVAFASKPATPWRGIHLMVSSDSDLQQLSLQLPKLSQDGVNVLILEVDYNYQFTGRPEMADPNGVSKSGAQAFATLCRQNKIRVIPEINCLGHQSWAKNTDTLLTQHPELDETPGLYPGNKGIYCRSYCPLHPDLGKVLFPLIDDLIDGFHSDAFMVGMDEVFLIGTPTCPRCKGIPTADLFTTAVKTLHDHVVRHKHCQMLMWGDRLLDGAATGYGEWEASEVGTSTAIDRIPKDIVMCDWHYEKMANYPSIDIFVSKGFKVWPSTWKNVDAANAFCAQAKAKNSPLVMGVLCTTWGSVKIPALSDWPALQAVLADWKS